MSLDRNTVTRLLKDWRAGNQQALDQLAPIIYDQLHRLARNSLRREHPGHTLSTTDLVHEAYLRLVDANVEWNDRVHFYSVAARVMRRVLVDYARAQDREKRGGGAERVSFKEASIMGNSPSVALLDLDEALDRLAARDQRKSEIVELLFFGGLTYDETAEALGISPATVDRELRMAKAWLLVQLNTAAHT